MTDDLRDLLAEALESVDDVCGTGDCRSHIDEALAQEDAYSRLADSILSALPIEAVQDWLDGQALRRLREMLIGRDMSEMDIAAWRADDGRLTWRVMIGLEHGLGHRYAKGYGDTLADAVNAYREALG